MDNYNLLNRIGAGRLGDVFLGQNKLTKDFVAVKIQRSPEHSPDFEHEITILKKVSNNCKGLVCIKDYWFENSRYTIVTDYIEGVSLFDYMRTLSKKLKITQVIKIINQIIFSLHILHSNGIAHRDIKPENIMINPDTLEVRIIDLGAACFNATLDEICVSQQRDDIFRVGIILFIIIAGHENSIDIFSKGILSFDSSRKISEKRISDISKEYNLKLLSNKKVIKLMKILFNSNLPKVKLCY